MMRAISRKLRSQRGASLLLALLFLLICAMVAASILMAAAANAGKHHSNLEEHQIYMTLSSAVSTLCDEITRSEYRGRFHYWETEETVRDPETGKETEVTRRHFKQLDGSFAHISPATGDGYLKSELVNDFDGFFSKEITGKLNESEYSTFDYKTQYTRQTHLLTVVSDTETGLDEMPVYITLTVEDSYIMEIVAYLEGLESYKVKAELTPVESKPLLPTSISVGEFDTDAMRWKLVRITVYDEKEGGETPG